MAPGFPDATQPFAPMPNGGTETTSGLDPWLFIAVGSVLILVILAVILIAGYYDLFQGVPA